nr:exopolysaccharide biosynthesis polyprenyl glycosylphosphotransferase [Mucilaginibacter sp. JXJ CY 39]
MRNIILCFLLLDLAIISCLMLLVSGLHYDDGPGNYFPAIRSLLIQFNIGWIITTLIFIDDMRNLKLGLSSAFNTQIKKIVVFVSIVSVAIISVKINDFSRTVFFGTVGLFILVKMMISLWVYYYYTMRDHVTPRPTVIIGNTKIGNELFRYFSKYAYLELSPIGILDDKTVPNPNNKVIGNIAEFTKLYEEQPFLDVIITLPLNEINSIEEIIFTAEKNGIRAHIIPNYYGIINRSFKVKTFGAIQMLDLRCVPLDGYTNRFWKRAFDLLFGLFLLVMLSPLLLFIAILIKLDSKGPVFYKPMRLGINGVPFKVFKFRSMYNDDDSAGGTRSTVLNDSRITKLGKYLRKYNLDELPQLLNVINNEMSLVGPRPHRLHLNMTLKQKMNSYMVRHWVKPGITGWAQVNGWRGPTENKLQYRARTLHDLWYLENWNFWIDIYIIILTVFGKKTNKNAF